MIEKSYIILRKLSFWLSLGFFVIFLPFVIYYSLGYKLNAQTKKFVKTGIISIESQPQGAEVILNGKDLKKSTPLVL